MSARLCQDGEFGSPPGRFASEAGLQRPGVSGQARAVQTPHSSLPGKDTLHSGRLTDRIRRRGSSPHTDSAKSKHNWGGGGAVAGEKANHFSGEWMKVQHGSVKRKCRLSWATEQDNGWNIDKIWLKIHLWTHVWFSKDRQMVIPVPGFKSALSKRHLWSNFTFKSGLYRTQSLMKIQRNTVDVGITLHVESMFKKIRAWLFHIMICYVVPIIRSFNELSHHKYWIGKRNRRWVNHLYILFLLRKVEAIVSKSRFRP